MIYSLRQSFRSVLSNKKLFLFHSFVSAICFSIITLFAISFIETDLTLQKSIDSAPTNQIIIETKPPSSDFQISTLTLNDLTSFSNASGVESAVPLTFFDYSLEGVDFRFLATTPAFLAIENLDLEIAETLDDNFIDGEIILSQKLASRLWNTPILIGRLLDINGQKLSVGNLWKNEISPDSTNASETKTDNIILVSPKQFLTLFHNYQIQKILLEINDDFDASSIEPILQNKNLIAQTPTQIIAAKAEADKRPLFMILLILLILSFFIIVNNIIFLTNLHQTRTHEFTLYKIFGAPSSHQIRILLTDIFVLNFPSLFFGSVPGTLIIYLFRSLARS